MGKLAPRAPEFLQREMLECLWIVEKTKASRYFPQLILSEIQDKIGIIRVWVEAVTSYHNISEMEDVKLILKAFDDGGKFELAELRDALQKLVAVFCT